MKIVIVDDAAGDRRLCRILLEEAFGPSLEVFEVSGGAQALEFCRYSAPDCLLLDYKLPDMTGLEFLARLRPPHSASPPDVAVVMLTGLASEQVAVEAMKAGAQDYLVKDRITGEGLKLAVTKATEKVGLIRELELERDRLAHSLAEKEVLLKEVHHRVKNNLAVIASLLRLQANSMPDQRLHYALRESQNRVESMGLIHEQLYASEDLREVDLAQHAALLAGNLFHSYGIDPARISWTVNLEPLPLGVDQAIPAGLILNELISNALKHAFPWGRSGSIVIEGGRRGGMIELTVRDDGVGISAEVDLARPRSLGLQIIAILTRQLKGAFELKSSSPATFRISFPEVERGFNEIMQSAGSGR